MQELEPTWGRVASVWWLVLWRAALGGFALGAAFGFVIGFGGAIAGYATEDIGFAAGIVGIIVGFFWSFVVLRMALQKKYRGFRIALVAPH